jgi:hypothetical protein
MSRKRIARLTSNGSLDPTFNPGLGADSTVSTIAVQPNGRVLIGGSFTTFNNTRRIRLARLLADGALDTTFDPGLGATETVTSIAVETGGNIVIGGGFLRIDNQQRLRIA